MTGAALAAEDDKEVADEEETACWGDKDAPLRLLVVLFEFEFAAGVVGGFAGVARAPQPRSKVIEQHFSPLLLLLLGQLEESYPSLVPLHCCC